MRSTALRVLISTGAFGAVAAGEIGIAHAQGQVSSLTSTNNFINFCKTTSGVPLTNGQQVTGGSCNPAPVGAISPP
jgi:hypothetical protein